MMGCVTESRGRLWMTRLSTLAALVVRAACGLDDDERPTLGVGASGRRGP
jgi:hypothetical protein